MAVTIKDVAARCGLSVSTVSKAFNNYSDISDETRELVHRTARDIGYFPNAIARTLKTSRSYNVGVLYNDEAQAGLTHVFFAMILEAFKRECERHGYDVTFINHHVANTDMTYLEHCHYRNMDGVFIACAEFYQPEIAELCASDVPCVTVDHLFPNCSASMSDNTGGIRMLVNRAVHLGHTRIALVYAAHCEVTKQRVEGYRRALADAGLTVREEYLCEGRYMDMENASQHVNRLLDLPQPPTCILMPDDVCCLGALRAASLRGLRIPEDLSIAGFDGIPLGQASYPKLTTIRQDARQLGAKGAEMLIGRIEDPAYPCTVHHVPVTLVEGESMGAVPVTNH